MRLFAHAMLLAVLCLGPRASDAQQVSFMFDEVLEVANNELVYTLDLDLIAAAPTRVAVNALLDLREIQRNLSESVVDNAIIDGCGLQVKLDELSIVTEDNAIALESLLSITRFDCGRISKKDFRRGDQIGAFSANLSTVVSVELQDNCAYFKVFDLILSAPESERSQLLEEKTLSEVKSFLLAAIDLVLSETPICPKLPAELASLDPIYENGGPQEIEDGGLGIFLSGSLDVSPATIIDVLLLLQQEELIPAPP